MQKTLEIGAEFFFFLHRHANFVAPRFVEPGPGGDDDNAADADQARPGEVEGLGETKAAARGRLLVCVVRLHDVPGRGDAGVLPAWGDAVDPLLHHLGHPHVWG